MKGFKRTAALLLACIMVFTLFLTGCGQKEPDITTGTDDSKKTESTAVSADKPKEENSSAPKNSDVKKKVVIIQEDEFGDRIAAQKNAIAALEKGGFANGKNTEIIELKMNGDIKKIPEITDKVKTLKPDVVLVIGGNIVPQTAKPLEGIDIPVILDCEVSGFVDESGKPKQNITGLYTFSKDLQKNAFAFLNKIFPITGKKAVFITLPVIFTKAGVEQNLKSFNIDLKDYCETTNFDEYQAAVEKYNKDNEVGWILVGVWPTTKRDGSSWTILDTAKWDIANRKKPTVSYWEIAAQLGIESALGVDIAALGTPSGEMAVRILNGEKVQNVKADYPTKINIVLNQKRAQDLGITFPAEALGGASKVYTDYEGNYKK